MAQIRIDFIQNGELPINVFISDIFGNNKSLIGVINSSVPPIVTYNTTLPEIFDTAPSVMVSLVDSKNCEISKVINCYAGCRFEITIQIV